MSTETLERPPIADLTPAQRSILDAAEMNDSIRGRVVVLDEDLDGIVDLDDALELVALGFLRMVGPFEFAVLAEEPRSRKRDLDPQQLRTKNRTRAKNRAARMSRRTNR